MSQVIKNQSRIWIQICGLIAMGGVLIYEIPRYWNYFFQGYAVYGNDWFGIFMIPIAIFVIYPTVYYFLKHLALFKVARRRGIRNLLLIGGILGPIIPTIIISFSVSALILASLAYGGYYLLNHDFQQLPRKMILGTLVTTMILIPMPIFINKFYVIKNISFIEHRDIGTDVPDHIRNITESINFYQILGKNVSGGAYRSERLLTVPERGEIKKEFEEAQINYFNLYSDYKRIFNYSLTLSKITQPITIQFNSSSSDICQINYSLYNSEGKMFNNLQKTANWKDFWMIDSYFYLNSTILPYKPYPNSTGFSFEISAGYLAWIQISFYSRQNPLFEVTTEEEQIILLTPEGSLISFVIIGAKEFFTDSGGNVCEINSE